MSKPMDQAVNYAQGERNRFIEELIEFLKIPSVSSDPARSGDVGRAAEWIAERLESMGATEVKIYKTGRHPIVYGEVKALRNSTGDRKNPVVLAYGHYDVQRPDPVDEWLTEPFDPSILGDDLFARGAVDNKGPIMAAVAAVESLLKTDSLSADVKFMIEGEEEIGSPSLPQFLRDQGERLAADISLNGDAGMAAAGMPTITYALRGSAAAVLTIKGPSIDLHSGIFGGVVQNPIHVLSALIGAMHDEDGRVAIPGFYDDVRPLEDEERRILARVPRDASFYKRISGVPELWGEPGYTPVERTGARPTLDVLMIRAGADKSAIPSSARATVSMRLVPDQSPERVFDQLRAFIEAHAPPTVSWSLQSVDGSRPSIADTENPWIQAMDKALQETWSKEPVYDRSGGSIPAVTMLHKMLGIDSVLIGVFRPGDNIHAPNERLHLPTWDRCVETMIRFFGHLKD